MDFMTIKQASEKWGNLHKESTDIMHGRAN